MRERDALLPVPSSEIRCVLVRLCSHAPSREPAHQAVWQVQSLGRLRMCRVSCLCMRAHSGSKSAGRGQAHAGAGGARGGQIGQRAGRAGGCRAGRAPGGPGRHASAGWAYRLPCPLRQLWLARSMTRLLCQVSDSVLSASCLLAMRAAQYWCWPYTLPAETCSRATYPPACRAWALTRWRRWRPLRR